MGDIVGVGAFTIGDYLAILNRQKWRMLMVAAAIATVSAAVVAYWPATYRSTATILIREADVPPELVTSATTVFADERVQAMQQRVTTSQNLAAIIEKLNLYPDERSTLPMGQLVDEMRGNIGLSIISADTTTKARDVKAAIAFTLWFDADNPRTAQQVANELVNLYLSERQQDREKRATSTRGFLSAEATRAQRDVRTLEAQIESFKAKYAGYLPEDRMFNTQVLDRTEGEILDVTRQARSLRERETMLQSQLAITPKYLAVAATQDPTSPDAQLSMLEGKLEAMRAKYGDKHPDVVALNRQISALRSAGATSRGDSGALTLQIQSLTADLEAMRRQYGPKHPEVTRLEGELRTMKARLATAPAAAATATSMANPAYAQLQIQLSSVKSELASVADQQRALEGKQEDIQGRIAKAPGVERDYVALRREYDAAVDRYLEIKSKVNDAELAQNLETEGGGETLSLTEPPIEPVAPIRPNRRIMLAIGLVAAVAGAGLFGILCDALDGRVHGWRQVAAITGQTPFATIPVIRTVADRRRSRAKEASLFVLAASSAAVALVYVHYVLFPMEGLWTDLMVRLGLTQWIGTTIPQAML